MNFVRQKKSPQEASSRLAIVRLLLKINDTPVRRLSWLLWITAGMRAKHNITHENIL